MKKIMIQGHSTRGKEVIKALKDLGGRNSFNFEGSSEKVYYYIDNGNCICTMPDISLIREKYNKNLYTLEEYLNTKNNMEKRTLEITLATAKEWYKGDNNALKELSLQAFTETELQPITCVKSWDEFCEQYIISENEYYIDTYSDINNVSINNVKDSICRDHREDRNLLKTKKDAEAFIALMQLKRLRDQWWEALNWKPDYTNKNSKYNILVIRDLITIDFSYEIKRFLTFPTLEIAKDFRNCFRDLIEKAKELI